jgi:hypothetical protein
MEASALSPEESGGRKAAGYVIAFDCMFLNQSIFFRYGVKNMYKFLNEHQTKRLKIFKQT